MSINSSVINGAAVNSAGGELFTTTLGLTVNVLGLTYTSTLPVTVVVGQPVVSTVGSLPLTVTVTAPAFQTSLPVTVAVTPIPFTSSLPLRVNVKGVYTSSVPLSVNVFDPNHATPGSATFWDALVILKGTDVTSSLTGTITVDAEEAMARTAEFTLRPTAGLIDITQWVSAPVTIVYRVKNSNGTPLSSFLLFTGVVDVPNYDPATRLTRFSCTDNLQVMIERMTRTQIQDLTDGHWSPFIFDEGATPWTYAQDLLSTQPYAFDLDVYRKPRKTAWAAKVTPDFTFTENAVLDGSVGVSLVQSRDLINEVDMSFNYRFQRLYERRKLLKWEIPESHYYYGLPSPTHPTVFDAITGAGYCLPMQKTQGKPLRYDPALKSYVAADGTLIAPCVPSFPELTQEQYLTSTSPMVYSGALPVIVNVFEPLQYLQDYVWSTTAIQTTPLPNPTSVSLPIPEPPYSSTFAYLADTPRFSGVIKFEVNTLKRYSQTVTESHYTVIKAPTSIASNGRLAEETAHAVDVDYGGDRVTSRWDNTEQASITHVVSRNGAGINGGTATPGFPWVETVQVNVNRYEVDAPDTPDGNINDLFYWDRDKSGTWGRGAMHQAYLAAHGAAERRILESHRRTSVSFTTPIHPLLDLTHTVRLDLGYTPNQVRQVMLQAKGKVRQIQHTLDINAGSALTVVTLAISKPIGVGAVSSTVITPPEKPRASVCQQIPFNYDLSTWPPVYWDKEETVGSTPGEYTRFRGWNCFTQEFVIESPGLLEDNVTEKVITKERSTVVNIPDDELLMQA